MLSQEERARKRNSRDFTSPRPVVSVWQVQLLNHKRKLVKQELNLMFSIAIHEDMEHQVSSALSSEVLTEASGLGRGRMGEGGDRCTQGSSLGKTHVVAGIQGSHYCLRGSLVPCVR